MQIMISTYKHKKLTWIDLDSPSKEEVRAVMEEYDIHPLVADELLSPTLRPKVDIYKNHIYLILHFPIISHKHDGHSEAEVDFIIGKDFLITTHYGLFEPLTEFSKIFEVNSILEKSNMTDHAGFLFFYLIRELYNSLTDELDFTRHALDRIKEKIFTGHEAEMVQAISITERDLIGFKQAIQPHKEVLESFETASTKMFGKDFSYYANSIIGEYFRIYNRLGSQSEILLELRETNDSLLTTKTNEIMKVLTVMASLLLPAALIASIFGMNSADIPIVGKENDFWIIVWVMVAATVMLFLYFKYKKWI